VLSYTANTIQLRKDAVRIILSNEGSQGSKYMLKSQGMQFSSGQTVVEVLGCRTLVAGQDGEIEVEMEGGRPMVLVPRDALGGSGVCGM
jgi:alpha-amylase